MRTLLTSVALLGALVLLLEGVRAQDTKKEDAKEVALKGKITCAKCDLSVTDDCATVIVVTKDKKDTVYYFDAAGHKKFHGPVCSAAKNGTVTGVVSEKDKKKIITVKTVTFD